MRPRKKSRLPMYVYDKGGFLWFERRGYPAKKFHVQDATSADFFVEYASIMSDGGRPEQVSSKRNFSNLVDSYIRSKRYRKLAASTRDDYDKCLKFFKGAFNHILPKNMRRRDVLRMRDANSDRMRFANYTVQVISVLFEHAIDLDWCEYNPAKGVELLKSSAAPRRPWPQHLIDAFREAADGRTLLMFELLLSTSQRIQDVLEFRWSDLESDGVNLTQNKTGKSLWVPLSDRANTLLSSTPKNGMTILCTSVRYGHRPLSYRSAQQSIQTVREKIGAMDFDIHSLRYSAACELALAGCSDEELSAITGQTTQTVKHYTQSVRQKAAAIVAQKARERYLNRNAM